MKAYLIHSKAAWFCSCNTLLLCILGKAAGLVRVWDVLITNQRTDKPSHIYSHDTLFDSFMCHNHIVSQLRSAYQTSTFFSTECFVCGVLFMKHFIFVFTGPLGIIQMPLRVIVSQTFVKSGIKFQLTPTYWWLIARPMVKLFVVYLF